MDRRTLFTVAALLLSCMLVAEAAVLKVPATVTADTLEHRDAFAYSVAEQAPSAIDISSSSGSYKRSVVDSGSANIAYADNMGTSKKISVTNDPVIGYQDVVMKIARMGLNTVPYRWNDTIYTVANSVAQKTSPSEENTTTVIAASLIPLLKEEELVKLSTESSDVSFDASYSRSTEMNIVDFVTAVSPTVVFEKSGNDITRVESNSQRKVSKEDVSHGQSQQSESTTSSVTAGGEEWMLSENTETTEMASLHYNDSDRDGAGLMQDYRDETTDVSAENISTTTELVIIADEDISGSDMQRITEVNDTKEEMTESSVSSQRSTGHSSVSGHTEVVSLDSDVKSGRNLDSTYYEHGLSDEDNEVAVGSDDCSRACELGAPPRVCKFRFRVEWYHTMSKACFGCPGNASHCDLPHCVPADGVERPIIVANRQMPGPTVNVCLGDTVQVDVENLMTEETTSVHWHGQYQKGSPHMDGVPFVTQCPIGPASTFRYRFVANTAGTHFWHSHTGCQRADGLYGALLVRTPRAVDTHSRLYDEEGPVLQLADWGRPLGADKFANHHHAAGDNKPTAILVNGRGAISQHQDKSRAPPPPVFDVRQGTRYRFRVINNGFLNCPIELSIDNHTLVVISSDGDDIKPVKADSLVTYAGERWDFVLEANAAVSSYWIRFRGLMDCGEHFFKVHQAVVLRYEGSNLDLPRGELSWDNAIRPGLSVNTLNVGPGTPGALVMSELTARSPTHDVSLKQEPDQTFYLAYDFYAINNPHFHMRGLYDMDQVTDPNMRLFTPQLNHISLKLKPFPLLSQFSQLDERDVCNETTLAGRDCQTGYCECLHMLKVPLGSVVEMVLVDIGNMYDANHPFHLHGHAFHVVAMGKLGSNTTVEAVKALDEAGGIVRNLHDPPLKDTVTVPDGGFVVLRVHADNPGYWLFHCHIEFHVEVGMALVFKVGDHSDFPPTPAGFPQCNSWMPSYSSSSNEMDLPEARLIASQHMELQEDDSHSGTTHLTSTIATSISTLLLVTILR